ncbi:hypothetical protein L1987_04264 [Smallanthus sonchifolius]|uniref:Uncharacterized protein n=1 Tax=Smallanthus sonchifolius TaxID=185202 RepID=A0ACB9KCX4_9ASTR|nr:hypothetical protein L1987_04264 [Smallanthus sonchifolius]
MMSDDISSSLPSFLSLTEDFSELLCFRSSDFVFPGSIFAITFLHYRRIFHSLNPLHAPLSPPPTTHRRRV